MHLAPGKVHKQDTAAQQAAHTGAVYVILLHICNELPPVSTAAKMHPPKLSKIEQLPHREQVISMSSDSAEWGWSALEADWAALVQVQVARQLQVSSQPLILVKVRCSLGKPLTLLSPSVKPAGEHHQSAQKPGS